MAANDLLIDGWDANNANFHITDLPNRRATPRRRWQTARSALRAPQTTVAADPAYLASELVVQGYVLGSVPSDVDTNLDLLKSKCDRKDEVTLEFANDQSGRWFYARFTELEVGDRTGLEGPNANNPVQRVTLYFRLVDPFLYQKTTTTVSSIGAAGKEIPTGTAPTLRDLVFTLTGPATNPVITMESSTGGVRKTLTLTTLSSTETRTINMQNGTIVSEGSTNAIADRAIGSDFPFAIDPRDGVFSSSDYPVAKLNSGSLQVVTRKAYI